jgi:hypothetical protein
VSTKLFKIVQNYSKEANPPFTMDLVKGCKGLDCNNLATRASVYKDNVNPMWWCAESDPYQQGALPGRIQIIETYIDALTHVKIIVKVENQIINS